MTDRGFSTSGSALIIFIGLFGALTGLYVATANSTERVQDAQRDQIDHASSVQQTNVNVSDVQLVDDVAPCELQLQVNNTGSTTLVVNETDLLLDGDYQTGWEAAATVDGNANTGTWRPGETLTVSVGGLTTVPDRAKFVTAPGVAAVKDIDGGLVCSS